jgi:hypothetical protein
MLPRDILTEHVFYDDDLLRARCHRPLLAGRRVGMAADKDHGVRIKSLIHKETRPADEGHQ